MIAKSIGTSGEQRGVKPGRNGPGAAQGERSAGNGVGDERYRDLIEGLGVAVYTTDAAGRITLYNEAAVELWGRRPTVGKEEWCGSLRLFWPDGRPMAHDECPMAITLKEGVPVRGREAMAERPDGSRVNFVPYPTPVHDASGDLIGAVNVLVDITERKRAEQELRESEERLRMAMDAGGMGDWEWDMRTNQVTWSENLERSHGLEPGTFGGTFEHFLADVHPEDREMVVTQIQESIQLGTHDIQYRIIRPDGAVRWLAGRGRVVRDIAGQPARMIGVCLDITDRKRSEEHQRFLAEAGAVLGSSLDYDTVLRELSHLIAGRMADWCAVDLLEDNGAVRRLIVSHADPTKEDIARKLEQYYIPDVAGAPGLVEALSHGEAMLFPNLSDEQLVAAAQNADHLRLMRELGFVSSMIVPLRTRGRLLGAITFVGAESQRHYDDEDLALAEELAHRAGLAIDNARLYREANETQEELRIANEAKDEFLGLVSHELRTPITTIYGGARILRSRGDKLNQQSRTEIVEDIERETERLHRIVEDLLVLARLEFGQGIAREPVLLQRVLEKAAKNFGQRNPTRSLELRIASELGPVIGEANYLEQVMRNLLNNAEKYSPQGSPIEVCAEAIGGEAIVSVRDRGPGIAPDEAESIFERFYRAKKTSTISKGLGLGLTVCKRLIEAQGGSTWARPREGGGLEIGFTLPLYEEE